MKLFGILLLVIVVAIGVGWGSVHFGLWDPPGITDSGKEAIEQAKTTAPELKPAETISLTQAVEAKANTVILDLSSKNISGPLLPSLGELTTLKELYLNNNQVTALPPEIGKLINLEVLDVSKNPTLTDLPPALIPEGAQLFD